MFFECNNSLFGLGAENGSLYIMISEQIIRYETSLFTLLNETGETRNFQAFIGKNLLYQTTYKFIPASGWIPNEDDECLDGFLWIHNVIRSPERRDLFLNQRHG
jgi:hypothetical protein